ncbi:MAG: hypothetical protein EBX99_14000 [Acidimicrobiia bacterium]|nr:hypothetical protein [Acidimicrobiia bacterium]
MFWGNWFGNADRIGRECTVYIRRLTNDKFITGDVYIYSDKHQRLCFSTGIDNYNPACKRIEFNNNPS